MAKKLVSVWVDSAHIEKIKTKKPISEFIRNAIENDLQPMAYTRGSGDDINMCIFCLENGIPLEYADYVSLLISLDLYSDIDILTDKETQIFAAVTSKILQIAFPKSIDIRQGAEGYFTDYLIVVDPDKKDEKTRLKISYAKFNTGGFTGYVSYLITGLKANRFMPLGLVRALEVCMRDKVLIENKDDVLKLCKSLDNILLKLAKHVVEKSPDVSGFPYSSALKGEITHEHLS